MKTFCEKFLSNANGDDAMINIDAAIQNAPQGDRQALLAEKQSYERIHETTKAVLAEVGIETHNQAVISLLEDTGLAG